MCSLAASSPGNKSAIAAAGAIPPLARLLRWGSAVMQEAVAYTLWNLAASSPRNKAIITAAGAIPALVRLLGSPGAAQHCSGQ